MTHDAHAQEEQRLRTERGLSMLASAAIRFEPDGRHAWHATDLEGGSYLVSLDHCNCEDFARRSANNGLRCKHMEALRISLSALGAEPGAAQPDTLMQRLSAPFTPEAVHWKPQRVDALGKRAEHPNHVWSLLRGPWRGYDVVVDQTEDGRQLKMLPVVDEFARECLSIDVERHITAQDVVARLQQLLQIRGIPDFIRSDNGPEFIAIVVKEWLSISGVKT